ncbi:MAG: terminase small subunit protein [Caldilineaceae bacterium]
MPAKIDDDKRSLVVDFVLSEIAAGKSARSVFDDERCLGVHRATFLGWCVDDQELATRYARAMAIRIEGKVLDMEAIADDGRNDFMEGENGPRYNPEAVARSKLRLEQRRWEAEKLVPKKYGARVALEHSGSISVADRLREAKEKRRSAS